METNGFPFREGKCIVKIPFCKMILSFFITLLIFRVLKTLN